MAYINMIRKTILASCIGLFFIQHASAQQGTDSAKNVFTASINYQSQLHYFGRVDSLKSSGVFPVISFKSKTGLYINSSFIFIRNLATSLHYTGTILEGGYKLPDNKTITGNIYYDQFLYKQNTVLRQAAIKSQTGINTTLNNKIANINLNGDVKFSPGNTDFGATFGLDRLMIWRGILPGVALAVDPSVFAYGGTQKFTTTSKQTGLFGLPQGYATTEYTKFSLLSIELSMPIVLVKGKFNAFVSPAYVMPQNRIIVQGRPDLSEHAQNLFYVTAGVGVKL